MTAGILVRCSACHALANPHWSACLACQRPLGENALDGSTSIIPSPDWQQHWRKVAQHSRALSADDPRYDPMLTALAECDVAYQTMNEPLFLQATERVLRVAGFVRGASVYWLDQTNQSCGPATVLDVVFCDGKLWVWLEWDHLGRWLNELVITSIEAPKR